MYLPAHNWPAVGRRCWSTASWSRTQFSNEIRRNTRMKHQSKGLASWILKMLPAMIALLFTFNTVAAAQDQKPKWELYGGYSFFYPRTTVTGTLPGALSPLSSRVESNPNGVGVSGTFNFNRWFGITLDGRNNWGSGETTVARVIRDCR